MPFRREHPIINGGLGVAPHQKTAFIHMTRTQRGDAVEEGALLHTLNNTNLHNSLETTLVLLLFPEKVSTMLLT